MSKVSWFTLIILGMSVQLFSLLFPTIYPTLTLAQSPLDSVKKVDFGRHFRELKVEGSILIYDPQNQQVFQFNENRNKTAFPTASTFKILNSLIALETGVITDEISVLTWDGITREIPTWNRDLNLREAFKISAVWFYQVLARRVGYEPMKKWITQVSYGNQNLGEKDDLDQFWLNGKLQISPQQQIQFLHRLYENNLPFSPRTMSIVKDIMIQEKTPDYILRGKTGWFGFGRPQIPNIGWYVGYLERGKNVYFFVTNIEIRQEKDGILRLELTRRCLQDLSLL